MILRKTEIPSNDANKILKNNNCMERFVQKLTKIKNLKHIGKKDHRHHSLVPNPNYIGASYMNSVSQTVVTTVKSNDSNKQKCKSFYDITVLLETQDIRFQVKGYRLYRLQQSLLIKRSLHWCIHLPSISLFFLLIPESGDNSIHSASSAKAIGPRIIRTQMLSLIMLS